MTKKLTVARRFIAAGIVSLMAIIGTASLNAQGLEEGLIGYWPFDDQSDPESTPDMSEGGNHGTVNGEPEFVTGATGGGGDKAIQFDGADDSVTTEVSLLNDLEELTLSFWMLMPEAQPGNRVGLIGQNDAVEYGMINPTTMQYWTPAGNINVDFGPTLEEWTHVAVIVNADGMHVYANGEQIGTAGGGGAVNSAFNFNMGGSGIYDGTGNWFLGSMDDVAVWNIALSEDQIAALAAQQIFPIARYNPLHEGLIAYWPFDGDLQDTIGDSHGTGMGSDDIAYGSGKFGQGIELDGVDQYVETPLDNEEMFDFQDGTGFSISAWYQVGEFTKNWQALIAKGEGNRWRVHRRGGENILTGNGGNGDVPAGTPDINDGELHHIVLVSDPENDEVRLYSDGELASSNNGPAIQSNENPMMIGENPDARNRTWSGIIDDVGIWNRPLSEEEISFLSGNSIGSPSFGPKIVGKFEADWTEDAEPEGTSMAGVAEVGDGFLHITDAVNGANGAFTIEDFSNGAVFTDFEMSFRLHMSDSTCCGGADDTAADHRPADGMSINIGNDLPDTIGLAEEGSGSGIRICFDTWDSGGGEAPAIDVWRGTEGEVGDGNQGGWSGGMLVRQKFNGVTSATEEEKFKDENGDHVWLWTQGEWVDVKISVKDGFLKINFKGHEVINHALPAAWQPMVGPNWLFAARTGGANSTHWIDDLSIVLYGNTAPGVSLFEADAGGWELQVTDIEEAGVDTESVVVTYEGEVLDIPATKVDGVTTIKYESAEILAPNSDHALKVSFKDSNGSNQLLNLDFTVKDYTLVDAATLADASLKGDSGFLVYATQISSGQGVGTLHGNLLVNAEKQINGEYIDPDTEEQYLNEADIDSFEGWSYYPEIVETVNQNQDAPGGVGNFQANDKADSTDREDEPLTGIPGWGDSTDGIASEYIALLDLERGAYKLGVNSDDGFSATIGANFGDLLAQQLGLFNGGRGASDTTFDIVVQEAGLYPYRVLWWEGGGGANIEIFSIVAGEKTLINDPDVEGSIKAYTIAGAVVDESTAVRATTGRAKVLSVSPAPGDSMVKSSEVVVVIQNEDTTVKQDTVVLSLNGEAVDANVSKSGDIVTISYSPDSFPVGAHTASISFEESNGITRGTDWSFGVPGVYVRSGDVPAAPMGLLSIREYHGIGGGALAALFSNAKFPDTPDVSTFATYFEWPNSGDIEVPPAANIRDNYGWSMMGYVYPPETGEYIFALATDDNSELWLSTDESPANAKLIASQGGWQPVRDYRAETTSAEIFLEAGSVYFIELVIKEGGGGDNAAVAWSLPEDGPSDPEPGALPISGDYLSPYFSVLDGEPSPILTSSGPSGAAIADTASISATFKNRGVAFTGVSVEVNGVAVEHTLAADGGTTTITADPGGVKGMVDVTLSWNGESKSWSYFGHDALDDGPNPIGFWDFNLDIGNGTTIDSVYGLVGQLRNGAAFTDDAHEGTAMDMTDGTNQHVHVAAGEFLNIASSVNQVTVAFWQKNYSIPSTSSFWAEPGRAMQAHVPWSDGQIYWDTAGCCGAGTQRINANATDFGGWGEDLLDTWHHYVFIKNEDAKEIWIDGELFHDGDNTNPLPSDINWLNIGGDAAGNNSIRGVIDDFAVFASALDEDQIMALAEGDRSILPAAPGHPILVSARSGGLPGLASYYVQTVGAVPGPWAFKDDVWVSDGSVAGCGGPYHDFLTSPDYIVSAAGEVSLSVDHRHAFEADMWDAGQLWISVNGGAYADVGKDAFSANGYTDKAIVGNGIAKGENGFGGTSAGYADGSYITTTANLGSFAAGDAVSVRIVALYDDCATGTKPNWVVAGVSSDQMVMSSVPGTANLEVVLIKRADALSGEKLSVNGTDVAASVATDGNTITITGTATDLEPGTAVATVSYNGQSSSWTFTVPERAIDNGDGTITYNGHVAWEWWDGIGGAGPITLLSDNARYPDSPDGATFASSFNTRTALAGGFEGNGRDSYGGRMSGILTAPEDGTYRFFVASDDASVLRISTDTDPANAVQVAQETGCCKNFTLDDGGLSGTVDLVAGNQYYMEALLKEGGGGDWMTVGWRKPSEDIDDVPAGNQEGIPGEYFTGTVKVPALSALSSSVSISAGTSMDPKATITLNVTNGATTLDAASVAISLGGTKLTATATEGTWTKDFGGVAQSGATYSISADTGAIAAGTEHSVSATFKDSAGETTTLDATFTIPVWEIYNLGTAAPGSAAGVISVREYWGVGGGSISQLESHATFPDSPTVEKDAGYFEWPQSGDINVKPAGNVMDNYGVQMIGFLHPPATGDYQFAIASDDNSQLWLSTDANPANRVLIAKETGWQPLRKYQPVGDEATSAFISLEAGKAYYIEALMNEGGGGDNLAVAWTTGDAIVPDALPISGEYLSPWVTLEVVEIVDVSQPGDPVVPTSDNHPGGEHAGLAIDDNAQTKYLNFDKLDTGLTISTGGGVVTGLGLTSANDAPDRDPASFVLSGSNDGGATFTEIASGDVAAFTARFERQEVSFANEAGYSTYHLIFPTVANEGGANSMQIAEIELIGTAWGIYSLGTAAPGSAAGSISLREFDPVPGTSIAELIAHPSFPDSPTLETNIGYFEWPQSGDIAVNPEGNVKDNYGAQLVGFLHPPETGDYQFALAADDNAQLWLSTDESAGNRQLIAQETGWQPVRGYQAVGDEATSEFITLEGGKAYYIEALFNEGGGGDNIAVAWTTGDAVAAGAQPIAGEFLSPWIPGALTEPTIVDFGDLSGDASYEFFFNATKAGASTAIAGNDAFAFKLDQWNEQGLFGTTVFGVADNLFTAVEGKSVASVFDRDVHVVLVNDTAAGETRLYVDGDHVGVLAGNFELAGEAKVMGARIAANTDPMGDGSVMHKWAVYNSALSGAEIADLAAAVGAGGGGGDAPALSIVNNGDGSVTVTFEGKLQGAASVNGPWADVEGAVSPQIIPASDAMQFGRAVSE